MTSDPHESTSTSTSDSTANEDRNKPRIKIGSQREGAPPPRVPPRVKTLFSTPDPTATAPQPAAPAAPAPAAPAHAALPPAPATAALAPAEAAPAGTTRSEPEAAAAAPPVEAAAVAAPLSASTLEKQPAVEARSAADTQPAAEAQPTFADESTGGLAGGQAGGQAGGLAAAGDFQPKPAPLAPSKIPRKFAVPARTGEKVPPPNLRAELPPELAQELAEALGEMSVDDLLAAEAGSAGASGVGVELEPESRLKAKVLQVHRDNVFFELPGRNQGVVSIRQFAELPEPGAVLDVLVIRFNAEDGLYELSLPDAAVQIGDWSQVAQGMVVEAVVTGHNKGGLEVEVSRLKGFIPISQVALHRVEQLDEYVGQKFPCVVTEANSDRRNLVLSRRAMLEREQAEAKKKLLEELAPGQVREGIVRSLRDFGAFVDLGGVDGLLHVSQISWDRIKHPSDVLHVGQKVKVKIEKIDPESRKIGLTLRDSAENPWANVATKYPVTSRVTGTVSKLTDFGAFVRLEAGVEGLIHISELAHQRVFRASDVVSEGQEVEVKVVSVDPEAQRIGLSLKALQARPEPMKKAAPEPEEPEPPKAAPPKRKVPLKGGLGRVGDHPSGLRW